MTLLIETPRGVITRTIPNVSPLRPHVTQGYAAEAATHDAASVWGLPDFVYRPQTSVLGSGVRELGDGIIIAGDLGVVVQIKSREAGSSDPDKERRWLVKNATKALRQANGTIRTLKLTPTPMSNLRGRRVEIDGTAYRWLTVVVLDHHDPPAGCTPSLDVAQHPAVVLLRRDWEFLFDQLKSMHAVSRYLERVANEELELGNEPIRYYELAQVDAAADPQPMPPELMLPTARLISSPLLPLIPAATDDRRAHEIIRIILEDIARTPLTSVSETDRLRILAELDRLPVGQRAEIGRFVLNAMAEVTDDVEDGVLWRMRSVRGADGRTHLGYGACSHTYDENIARGFKLWVQLRHYDLLQAAGGSDEITTVAVLITPRTDGRRPWDTSTAAVSGPVSFEPEDLATLRALFPRPGLDPHATSGGPLPRDGATTAD